MSSITQHAVITSEFKDVELGQTKTIEDSKTIDVTKTIEKSDSNHVQTFSFHNMINDVYKWTMCIFFFPIMFLIGPLIWMFYLLSKQRFNKSYYFLIIANIIITTFVWLIIFDAFKIKI